MIVKAPIRNIVLDTSFIETQNFLKGTIWKDLRDISKKKWGSIFITDIVYNEVLSRFRKRIVTEEEKAKNIHNQIKNSLKVLKNDKTYIAYFNLPVIDINAICDLFKINFNKFLKDLNVKNISTGHLSIKEVFNNYFEGKPPFGKKDKKNEFPDAFAYQATHEYFFKIGEPCYLITLDEDFFKLPKHVVIPIKHPRSFLDEINRYEAEKKSKLIILFIEETFNLEKLSLQQQTNNLITTFIEEEVALRGEIGDMEIDVLDHLDLNSIEISDYKIVSMGEGEARLECATTFSYNMDIAVEDKTDAVYDKEDDRWFFVENKTINIRDSVSIVLTISVAFDQDLEDIEFTVEDINDGNGFNIFTQWDHNY